MNQIMSIELNQGDIRNRSNIDRRKSPIIDDSANSSVKSFNEDLVIMRNYLMTFSEVKRKRMLALVAFHVSPDNLLYLPPPVIVK
jgi:hypothetical protein